MAFYKRFILPNVIGSACTQGPIMKQRSRIVPEAKGVVAEIGIGSAPNLAFYDRQKVKSVIGIEPNPGLRKKAERAITASDLDVELLDGLAEKLPLENGKVDTVLMTYTMCSLPDVRAAMEEIRRVLKPGGQLVFCEHGAAPDPGILKWQKRLDPFWKRIGGGCHLSRPIDRMIEAGGFRFETLRAEYIKKTPKIVGYDYFGVARPS